LSKFLITQVKLWEVSKLNPPHSAYFINLAFVLLATPINTLITSPLQNNEVKPRYKQLFDNRLLSRVELILY